MQNKFRITRRCREVYGRLFDDYEMGKLSILQLPQGHYPGIMMACEFYSIGFIMAKRNIKTGEII